MGKLASFLFSAFGKLLGQSLVYTTFAVSLVAVIFTSLWVFGDDIFMFFIDKIFVFIGSMIGENTMSVEDYNFMNFIRQLPPDMLNLLAFLNFSYCLKIILSAITARFILNLIPFVRL